MEGEHRRYPRDPLCSIAANGYFIKNVFNISEISRAVCSVTMRFEFVGTRHRYIDIFQYIYMFQNDGFPRFIFGEEIQHKHIDIFQYVDMF